MKKLIVISIVVFLVVFGGCTINTENELSPTPTPEAKVIFIHDLVDKTLEETIEILNDTNLEFEVVEEYSETIKAGHIIAQSIAFQSEIEENDTIVLTVSKGSEYVAVPNIVAMTRDESIEVIENKLLTYEFLEMNSASVKEGFVISQEFEPGTMIKIGDTITVSISLGPVKIQMVDLLNHTEAYVNSFFNDVSLECEISYEQSNTVESGKVISQSIAAENYANEGETIYVVISEGLVEFMLEDYTGRPLSEVTGLLDGKCSVETRLDYNPDYEDRTVIGQNIASGTPADLDSRLILTVNNWEEKPISFADAGLDQLIRGKINKPTGTLIYSDVKDIMNLSNYNITHDKIRSLEGIENLKSLKSLYLFGENITDVTPLAGLTELLSLNLECNDIQDVSSLANLVKIQNIGLSANPITDISILVNMPDLEDVSLSGCPISSIEVLRDYTNMSFLNISHTYVPAQEVRDIVSTYTKLRALHMTDIDVGNLDFLTCYNTLTFLSADFCGLVNMDCLENFPYLKNLRIYHNDIEDITPLQNLDYLETLFIGYNNIHDISTLANLKKLDYLFISEIKATDFSVIGNLTKLKTLYISSNIISDVEFLRPLVKLETLEICSDIQDITNYYEIIDEHKDRGCDVGEQPQ